MHHHNQLEKFLARGREAQRAVDAILSPKPKAQGPKSKTNLPAVPTSCHTAGNSGPTNESAGGPAGRPRSKVDVGDYVPVQDVIACIEQSEDLTWLRKLMANADNPFAVRVAAEKRLKVLYRSRRDK